MQEELKIRLIQLADKYETLSFLDEDPSQFTRWYTETRDVELACFIAAMLAFGNRKQFIPKIREILTLADKSGGIYSWISKGKFKEEFICPLQPEKKFYRFYSYSDMQDFFCDLMSIVNSEQKSLGAYFKEIYISEENKGNKPLLSDLISSAFPNSAIVPKGKASANKRIHMLLRWLVRKNSAVDLGIWNWYSPANLIIPLDVHVMQEGQKLGLISEKASANRKTAMALTAQLKEIWPEDPCKGDFALFGSGVNIN